MIHKNDPTNPYASPSSGDETPKNLERRVSNKLVMFCVIFSMTSLTVMIATTIYALFWEEKWGQIHFICIRMPMINFFLLLCGVIYSLSKSTAREPYLWRMSLLLSVLLPVLSSITTFAIVVSWR